MLETMTLIENEEGRKILNSFLSFVSVIQLWMTANDVEQLNAKELRSELRSMIDILTEIENDINVP